MNQASVTNGDLWGQGGKQGEGLWGRGRGREGHGCGSLDTSSNYMSPYLFNPPMLKKP